MSVIEKIKYIFSLKKVQVPRISKKEEVALAFFKDLKEFSSCDSIEKSKLEELQNTVNNYKTYCFNKKITDDENQVIDLFLVNVLQNIKREEVKKHLRIYLNICSKITSLDSFKKNKSYSNFIDTFIRDVEDFINVLNIKNSYSFYNIGNFIDMRSKSDFFENFYSKASYNEKVQIQSIFLKTPKIYKNISPENFDLLPENINIFLKFIEENGDSSLDKRRILNDYNAYLYVPVIEKIINTEMLFPKSDVNGCVNLLEDINNSFLSIKGLDKYEKIDFYKKSFSFLAKKEGVSEAFKSKVSCFPLLHEKNIDGDIAGSFIFENYLAVSSILKCDYYGYGYEINKVVRENKHLAPVLFSYWTSEEALESIFDMIIFKKSHMVEESKDFDDTLDLMRCYINIVGEEKIAKRDMIFKEAFFDAHEIYDDSAKIYMYHKIDKILNIVIEYPLVGKKIIEELFYSIYMNKETCAILRKEPVSVDVIQNKIKEKGIKINTLVMLDILKNNRVSAEEFIGFLAIEFERNIIQKFIKKEDIKDRLKNLDYQNIYFLFKSEDEKIKIKEKMVNCTSYGYLKKKRL